jgi:hypothetical protein
VNKTIDELWAYIVVDPEDEDEGMPLWSPTPGTYTPAMGAERQRMDSLRGLAEQVATDMQRPVRLVRFSQREEIETIEPGPKPEPAESTVVEGSESSTAKPESRLAEASDLLATDADVDVQSGVIVFSVLLDGEPTVCFQFFTGGEVDPQDVRKPLAVQGEHAAAVGPLAVAAYIAARDALRLQQN